MLDKMLNTIKTAREQNIEPRAIRLTAQELEEVKDLLSSEVEYDGVKKNAYDLKTILGLTVISADNQILSLE